MLPRFSSEATAGTLISTLLLALETSVLAKVLVSVEDEPLVSVVNELLLLLTVVLLPELSLSFSLKKCDKFYY